MKTNILKYQLNSLTGLILILIVALISCKRDDIEQLPSENSPQGKNTYEFPKGTVTDIDGNTYSTIIFGNQEWMVENMKVTHYPNGENIPLVESSTQWKDIQNLGLEEQTAYCYYNNDNTSAYGALYTWHAATANEGNNTGDIQGICPDGWHVPSDMEWARLLFNRGVGLSGLFASGYHGTDQGSQLAGTSSLWRNGDLKNNPAFNSSGFNGLPGGMRDGEGQFKYHWDYALWWTTTKYLPPKPLLITYGIKYTSPKMDRYNHSRIEGLSVRCVRKADPIMVTDVDGNIYPTLIIGNQTWLTQNLRTTRYANGDSIPEVINDSLWWLLDDTDKARCFYTDPDPPDLSYGALYTWAAVVGYDSDTTDSYIQGICPDGWHIPSDDEWKTLEIKCGMASFEADETGFRGIEYHVGSQLAGDIHAWYDDSYLKSHALFGFTGFDAKGAGFRSHNSGKLGSQYVNGFWWTATETNNGRAMCRNISSVASQVNRKDFNKANGFSARCIKDE